MERGGISLERVQRDGRVLLILSGALGTENLGSLDNLLESNRDAAFIDMGEFELEGTQATLEAVDAVRALLTMSGALTLFNSPQLLAHTLYRVGLLEGAGLQLVDTRQEEPYG